MCDHSYESNWIILSCNLVLALKSANETLVCDHSNESYWEVLLCGTVYYAVQGGSNFEVCEWNPSVWPFKWKLLRSTCMWYYALHVGSIKSAYESQVCGHWNESYRGVLASGGTAYYAVKRLTFKTVEHETLACDSLCESYWVALTGFNTLQNGSFELLFFPWSDKIQTYQGCQMGDQDASLSWVFEPLSSTIRMKSDHCIC